MKQWKRWLSLLSVLALCLTACAPKSVSTPAPSSPPAPVSTPDPAPMAAEPSPSPEEELALAYLSEKYQCRAYPSANAPGEPEEADLRLDGLTYLGEEVIYETVGAAYALNVSRYWESRNEAGEKSLAWVAAEPSCLVLERSGHDNAWQGVFGEASIDGRALSNVIFETAWGLMDIEVSLSIDGYPQRIGPGANVNFHFASGETAMAVLPDQEPIYTEGDEWRSYTAQDFEALCYYGAAEERETIHRIVTSRSDVETYRGVRVGDSREKVLEAYPEGLEDTYWGYEGDYLCYCEDEINQLGAALLFWFEDDVVVKLELVNMFN